MHADSPLPVFSCASDADASAAGTLLSGSRWANSGHSGPTVLTYSFAPTGSPAVSAFSADDQAQVRTVLRGIEAVCGVRFMEVADAAGGGAIRYGYSQEPESLAFAGMAYYPSNAPQGGDVWLAPAQSASEWDYYRPHLLLHETLHALGLKHPFSGTNTLATQDDWIGNTVMSYSPVAGSQNGALSKYPSQPMPLDVAALQLLYGPAQHNAGDTAYDLSAPAWHDGFQVLWDSGGRDRLDASGLEWGVRLDLAPGARSDIGNVVFAHTMVAATSRLVSYSCTLAIAQDVTIEDATGSACADRISGNITANRIDGGDGNDWLAGLGGDDLLTGGEGVDTAAFGGGRGDYCVYRGTQEMAVMALRGPDGCDTLRGVERLEFADGDVAFDMDGAAGLAARVAGAVWGRASLGDQARMGELIGAADSGMNAQSLAQWALDHGGGSLSNEAFVSPVYGNVTGTVATGYVMDHYLDLLRGGAMTQPEMAAMAAQTACNAERIDLAGLAQSGLGYLSAA